MNRYYLRYRAQTPRVSHDLSGGAHPHAEYMPSIARKDDIAATQHHIKVPLRPRSHSFYIVHWMRSLYRRSNYVFYEYTVLEPAKSTKRFVAFFRQCAIVVLMSRTQATPDTMVVHHNPWRICEYHPLILSSG